MNKLKLSVGFLPFLFSASCYSQSSVTLYGIVDAGFVYTNNISGGKSYAVASGNMQGSRWGLRGVEDVGDGLSIIFALENGFSITNGRLLQGGDEFGRQAYVGARSRDVGTVTVGRQYDSVVDYVGPYAAANQWATAYNIHPGDVDNIANSNRANNAVKFTSRTYSGITFGGVYGFGGVAGDFSRNQIWSAGANYVAGPLSVGAAYLDVRDPNTSFFGNNSISTTTASNITNVVYSGFASAKNQNVFAIGGAYTIGASTLGVMYTNTAFKDLGSQTGLSTANRGSSEHFHNAELNFKYQITPALIAGVVYDYTKSYGVTRATYQQASVGADYFLSKRTDLYVTAVYQHASGIDSTGAPARAIIGVLSASSTSKQAASIVGIRHKF